MGIQVEQPCPQCGGPVILSATDRLLTCPYCGVKNYLQSNGPFRYALPNKMDADDQDQLLHAPYLRFKGSLFFVTEKGISYSILNATRAGFPMPGISSTLGVRPQAMNLARLTKKSKGRFLRLGVKAPVLLEKAVKRHVRINKDEEIFHRAYVGESLSYIYLPLWRGDEMLMDGVVNQPLVSLDKVASFPLTGSPYNPRWQVKFLATLCPRCGWNLDGEGDCLILTCSNCDTAWQVGKSKLERVACRIVPGGVNTALYLAFWKISVHLPSMKIWSFADYVQLTNQPFVARKEWHDRVMSFWVPAFKLRPRIFLRTGSQTTVSQWRLDRDEEFHVLPNLYPVTLPLSGARQALKALLAVSSMNQKRIYPQLAGATTENMTSTLVFLPFMDNKYEWVQPETGAVIAKSVLKLGRTL